MSTQYKKFISKVSGMPAPAWCGITGPMVLGVTSVVLPLEQALQVLNNPTTKIYFNVYDVNDPDPGTPAITKVEAAVELPATPLDKPAPVIEDKVSSEVVPEPVVEEFAPEPAKKRTRVKSVAVEPTD